MKDKIRQYILSDIFNDSLEQEISNQDDLLSDGTIDSLGVMRLVAFIEKHAGLSIPPEDLILENFESIDAMDEYLKRRTK